MTRGLVRPASRLLVLSQHCDAQLNALVADVGALACNHLPHLLLGRPQKEQTA
jgi:hypothetical protein